jgi:hypothetical protein
MCNQSGTYDNSHGQVKDDATSRLSSINGGCGAAPNKPNMCFRHCFWGEQASGYQVLSKKMKHSLVVSKELISFFEELVELEEYYGKSMVKLTHSSQKGLNSDPDLATLHNSLSQINECHYEQLGKTHQLLASRLSEREKIVQWSVQ